jgi:NifU-like protein involved in Fe-S cluster formation
MKKPFLKLLPCRSLHNDNGACDQKTLMDATLKFCGKVGISASVICGQVENKNVQNALNVKGFFMVQRLEGNRATTTDRLLPANS